MSDIHTDATGQKSESQIDTAKIFADIAPSLVAVRRIYPEHPVSINGGGGSGFFVSSGAPNACEVATLNHVTESDRSIAIIMQTGTIYKAHPEKIDLPHEIAIYEVEGVKDPQHVCKPVELDTTPLKSGDKVLGLGDNEDPTHPGSYNGTFGAYVPRAEPERLGLLDLGEEEGEDMQRPVAWFDPFECNHGDSGGPLAKTDDSSHKSKVVGLCAAGDGYGFAELASALQDDLDQIRREREAIQTPSPEKPN